MTKVENLEGAARITISLRERALQAVDKKIAEDPFYTGRNAVFMGLATPIRKSPITPDVSESPGTTPQDFYEERIVEPQNGSGTPEGFAVELGFEQKEKEEARDERSADEMFQGSLVVQQRNGIGRRRDGSGIDWERQKNWSRNWEILGEYLGTAKTLVDLGKKNNITKQAVEHLIEILLEDVEVHTFGAKKRLGRKVEGKPHAIFRLRNELEDAESTRSMLIEDIENGTGAKKMNKRYGLNYVTQCRKELSPFGVEVPYVDNATQPGFFERYKAFSDPGISFERKKELFSALTYPQIYNRGKEAFHVDNLAHALKDAGLYVHPKEIPKLIQRFHELDPDIYIHTIKHVGEKFRLNYHFVALADSGKLKQLAQLPEFQRYQIPSVRMFGKPLPEGVKFTTSDLKKGIKSGQLIQYASVLSPDLRKQISEGKIGYEDIISEDAPGRIFVDKRGVIFLELEGWGELWGYIMKREMELGF